MVLVKLVTSVRPPSNKNQNAVEGLFRNLNLVSGSSNSVLLNNNWKKNLKNRTVIGFPQHHQSQRAYAIVNWFLLVQVSFCHLGFLIYTDLSRYEPVIVPFKIYVKLPLHGISTLTCTYINLPKCKMSSGPLWPLFLDSVDESIFGSLYHCFLTWVTGASFADLAFQQYERNWQASKISHGETLIILVSKEKMSYTRWP